MSVESVSIEQGVVSYRGFGKIRGKEVGRRRRPVNRDKEGQPGALFYWPCEFAGFLATAAQGSRRRGDRD